VVLLPVGAVEAHGPHLPLSTDTVLVEEVVRRALPRLADRGVRAVTLPALPYSVTDSAARFAGTIGLRSSTLRALVADVAAGLTRAGILRLCLVTCHLDPAHLGALRRCVEELSRPRALLVDYTRRHHAARLTEEFRAAACHGGRFETSLVLAAQPLLVRSEIAAGLPERPVDMAAEIRAGRADFEEMGLPEAYCGAPAEGTAEEGERTYAELAAILVERCAEWVAEPLHSEER
jgi:creatinine amidohydrolase